MIAFSCFHIFASTPAFSLPPHQREGEKMDEKMGKKNKKEVKYKDYQKIRIALCPFLKHVDDKHIHEHCIKCSAHYRVKNTLICFETDDEYKKADKILSKYPNADICAFDELMEENNSAGCGGWRR